MAERLRGSSPDLAGGLACALLALALSLHPLAAPVRPLIAIPFALFVPGYALLAALFPVRTLGATERFTAALAASLALLALSGVVLAALGLRLTATSFAGALTLVTLVASAVAVRRRGGAGPTLAPRWLSAAAVLLVAISAVLVAVALTDAPRSAAVSGYAGLWAERASPTSVRIGVESSEPRRAVYRLVVSRAGALVTDEGFTLAPGARREQVLAAGTGAAPLDIALYRVPGGVPYRRLTVPVELVTP